MTLKKSAEESSSKDTVPGIIRNDSWEDGDDDENENKEDITTKDPKKQKPKSQTLKTASPQSLAPKRPNTFHSFLQTTVAFASSATHTDRGLKLLCYTLWFVSRLTHRYKKNPELSPGLRKMYSDLSMVRYALRLYGLPITIEGICTGSWWQGWDDKRIHFLGKIMAWSMALYYPLEHVAYGGFVAPKLVRADAEKYSAWSCRAWGVYIVSDLVSSVLKLIELSKRRGALAKLREIGNGDGDASELSENEAKLKDHDLKVQMKLNRLHIARCILFLPPCANWSYSKWLTDPILSENVVNGCMLAEAITCFYQSISSLRNK